MLESLYSILCARERRIMRIKHIYVACSRCDGDDDVARCSRNVPQACCTMRAYVRVKSQWVLIDTHTRTHKHTKTRTHAHR